MQTPTTARLSVPDRTALATRMRLADTAGPEGTAAPRATFASSLGRQSLNGTWRFRWSATLAEAPVGVESEDFDDSGFDPLPVPSSWPMHGHGAPAYTNVKFPFPVDQPYPPDENPVGDHRLTFDLDADVAGFAGGTSTDEPSALLRFDGVDNAGEVWLNGTRLGTTRGSRLPHEFDVTGVLRRTDNVLVVRVAQWSATSYVEDQDMWWLPGIFRDVTLIPTPAGAIRDVRVRADWDPGQRVGSLTVEVESGLTARIELPELGLAGGPGETVTVEAEPWSPESPRRYDLVVSTDLERVVLPIGFRTVDVADSRILLNGRPILIRGVNRHEHHPDLGRVIPPDLVRAELVLMKQYNVNAIRTSHYPPSPLLLELADELGFYVIDECDLETHGFGLNGWRNNPSDDPAWTEALVTRMQTMVARDRNHPSIFCWSVGNESGVGANLAEMAQAARRLDDTRLIHYEGDFDSSWVDVYSRMYASPDYCEQVGLGTEPPTDDPSADDHRRGLPFLQCEYGHAMGNGPGGLTEYQRLFETHPRLNGGFIWEWLEHGIRMERDGQTCFGYGGDFGEPVHDGVFVIDGLVSADREPRPALHDLKKVFAPVGIEVAEDWSSVTVVNRHDVVGLDALAFDWTVDLDGQTSADGVLELTDCPAGEQVEVPLPDSARSARRPGAVLTVRAGLAAAGPWAEAGHEIAWGQRVEPAGPVGLVPGRRVPAALDGSGVVTLGPARFDPSTGELRAVGGVEVIGGPRLTLWRAPTDNDHGRGWEEDGSEGPVEADLWRRQGLDRLRVRVVSAEVGDDGYLVRQRIGTATADRFLDLVLHWSSDGDTVALRVELAIDHRAGAWRGTWPRIGLELELPGGLDRVGWRGRGPGQAYPDTGQSQRHGSFTSTVAELQTDYVRPQENGSRRAHELRLTGTDGTGLVVRGSEFGFAARPWSAQVLTAADHTPDLVPDGAVHLTLDHRQHGVGTAACGPGVLPAYQLRPSALGPDDLTFEFYFSPA